MLINGEMISDKVAGPSEIQAKVIQLRRLKQVLTKIGDVRIAEKLEEEVLKQVLSG